MIKKFLKTFAIIMCTVVFLSASSIPVSAESYSVNTASQSTGAQVQNSSGKGGMNSNPFSRGGSGASEKEERGGMVMSSSNLGTKASFAVTKAKINFIYIMSLTFPTVLQIVM